MIPHLLHHIWVGPKPVPTALVEAWYDLHPRWQHRLWREADLRSFGLQNAPTFEAYLKAGLWHGAANVARIEIVERLGGVYVDADSLPLRALDDGAFMAADLFAGYVQPRPEYPELIGNAYIGAIADHPVLGTARRLIGRARRLKPAWIHSGVVVFTRAVHLHQKRQTPGIYIAPTRVFFPLDKHGQEAPEGQELTYARHLWGSTISSPWSYGDPVP